MAMHQPAPIVTPSTSERRPFAARRALSVLSVAAFVGGLLPALAATGAAGAQEDSVSNGIQIVEDFVAAFNAKDVDRIMTFFTADAIYHNMPSGPVQGSEAVRNVIASYVNAAAKVDWEILEIAQVGTTVLTERIDRFVFGDKDVSLPVMGAFDLRDGKIAAWRDYFDQATWTRQMEN
jgi:limonene-1,2-epoxide hydrolase